MPTIGWFEILIVVAVAIIVLGPKDFPVMLKKVGSWIGTAKKYINNIQNEVSNIDIEENKMLLDDDELVDLAKEELKTLEHRKPELEEEIRVLMIPTDPNDDKNIYLELRAGTGGDEAALFVGDLYRAYIRYAENNNWKVELMNSSESESGGYKEIVMLVKGDHVFSKLKFEGGTHRVQRVPATESQVKLINKIAIREEVPLSDILSIADIVSIEELTKKDASKIIDTVMKKNKKSRKK